MCNNAVQPARQAKKRNIIHKFIIYFRRQNSPRKPLVDWKSVIKKQFGFKFKRHIRKLFLFHFRRRKNDKGQNFYNKSIRILLVATKIWQARWIELTIYLYDLPALCAILTEAKIKQNWPVSISYFVVFKKHVLYLWWRTLDRLSNA